MLDDEQASRLMPWRAFNPKGDARVRLRQSSEFGVYDVHNSRGKNGKDQRSFAFAQTFARRQVPLNQAS